jgi:hypothetical protein
MQSYFDLIVIGRDGIAEGIYISKRDTLDIAHQSGKCLVRFTLDVGVNLELCHCLRFLITSQI